MSSYSDYASAISRILESGANAQAQAQQQRGAIWGNALSGIGQQIASIPAQLQQAQAMKNQNVLTDLKVKEATREEQSQNALKGVLQKYNGDFEAALPELSAIDPKLGLEIGTRLNQSKIAQLDFQSRQFKAERDKVDWIHEQIAGATDPASYLQAMHTVAGALGPDAVKDIPPQYDPKVVDQYNQAALTAKERLDAKMKAVDDERQQRANEEKARHDQAAEAITAANQAADNQRQAEAAAETARHNRAEEGIAVTREKREAAQGLAGPGDVGLGSDVRTTATGRQYVDLSKYKGKDYHAAQQQAKAAGVYGASAAEVDALQNIETARANMALIKQNLGDLPSNALTRLVVGPLNKAEAATQYNDNLAAWGTWRTAAIQAMRALAGSKGLRINRSEIEASMANDVPNITDTQATAREKMSRVDRMLKSQENGILGPSGAAAPAAPKADPLGLFK